MGGLRFRNVELDGEAEVADWPPEALEIALDRGGIGEWKKVAVEIRRQPWGGTARTVEEIAGWDEHPGVDALFAKIIDDARQRVVEQGRRRWAEHVGRLRASTGLSLAAFAGLAGTSASRLSTYERGHVAPTTDVLARLEHVVASLDQPPNADAVRRGHSAGDARG